MDSVPPLRNAVDSSPQPVRTSNGRQPHRLLMAVVWTLVIMVLCWLPRSVVQEVEGESSWFKVPHLDKLVHCGIFVIFSILWLRVRPFRRPFGLVALSGFALAVLTEIVQGLPLIGRDTSIADMFTDVVGVLIGIAVAPLFEPLARFFEARLFRVTTGPALRPGMGVPAPGASGATARFEPPGSGEQGAGGTA
ncbi:MAG: VanZ family protein [Isosphaerales bacterium]